MEKNCVCWWWCIITRWTLSFFITSRSYSIFIIKIHAKIKKAKTDNTRSYYYYYYYYYYYTIWLSLVTGLIFLVLLLNQRWSSLLRLQASHCSTFRIMCDVPSIAVFCGESNECFPGTVSKFFLKLLVTIPVAPIITGTIVHFRFNIIIIIIIIIIDNCGVRFAL